MSHAFVTGGVRLVDDKEGIWTKKELKRLAALDPGLIEFYGTSGLGLQYEGRLNRIPENTILVVTGPDPYEKRRWHANITYDYKRDSVRVT